MNNHDMDSDVYVQKCPNDELPKGDAAALLRDWLDYKINRFDAEANAIILNTGADPDKLYEIADMVERDYVSREYLDEVRSEADYREGLLHESIDDLEAERDEWKAKAEQAIESYADAKQDRDAWIKKYKDAKHAMNVAAGKWERADARSAKRAAAVERLKNSAGARFSPDAIVCALLDGRCGSFDWSLECEAILDLLTDDDANDDLTHESDVRASDVDANDEEATQDSREQLEADVQKWCGMYAYQADMVWTWLNRQAAITERHWMKICGASANANVELKRKIDALTQANGDLREEWHRVCAERDKLNRELHACNRERERLRKQLGIAIDHAHDMIALVSVDTDEGLA